MHVVLVRNTDVIEFKMSNQLWIPLPSISISCIKSTFCGELDFLIIILCASYQTFFIIANIFMLRSLFDKNSTYGHVRVC